MGMSSRTQAVAIIGGLFALCVIAGCIYSVIWIQTQAGVTANREIARTADRMDEIQDRMLAGADGELDPEIMAQLEEIRTQRRAALEQARFDRPLPKSSSTNTERARGAYYPGDLTAETESGGTSPFTMLIAGLGGLFVFLLAGVGAFFGLKRFEGLDDPQEAEPEGDGLVSADPPVAPVAVEEEVPDSLSAEQPEVAPVPAPVAPVTPSALSAAPGGMELLPERPTASDSLDAPTVLY